MGQSILITQVGSTNATPKQYTAASPSLARYRMNSTIIDYGDYAGTAADNAAGITPNGFIYVNYRVDNAYTSATIYTSQTGAQIKTLIEA